MYVCMCLSLSIYIYVYTCIYIYIYIHIWDQAGNYNTFIVLIIPGSDQEKFNMLSSVTRKTVGAMRIVAKFRAGWW